MADGVSIGLEAEAANDTVLNDVPDISIEHTPHEISSHKHTSSVDSLTVPETDEAGRILKDKQDASPPRRNSEEPKETDLDTEVAQVMHNLVSFWSDLKKGSLAAVKEIEKVSEGTSAAAGLSYGRQMLHKACTELSGIGTDLSASLAVGPEKVEDVGAGDELIKSASTGAKHTLSKVSLLAQNIAQSAKDEFMLNMTDGKVSEGDRMGQPDLEDLKKKAEHLASEAEKVAEKMALQAGTKARELLKELSSAFKVIPPPSAPEIDEKLQAGLRHLRLDFTAPENTLPYSQNKTQEEWLEMGMAELDGMEEDERLAMQQAFARLVPASLTATDFWQSYFSARNRLYQDSSARQMLRDAINSKGDDEKFTWDDEEEAVESLENAKPTHPLNSQSDHVKSPSDDSYSLIATTEGQMTPADGAKQAKQSDEDSDWE